MIEHLFLPVRALYWAPRRFSSSYKVMSSCHSSEHAKGIKVNEKLQEYSIDVDQQMISRSKPICFFLYLLLGKSNFICKYVQSWKVSLVWYFHHKLRREENIVATWHLRLSLQMSGHFTVAGMDSCYPLNSCYFPSGGASAHKWSHPHSFHSGLGRKQPVLSCTANQCLIPCLHPGKIV